MGLGKGKKKAGKLTAMEKKEMPVETDPHKLVNYVCGSNIYTTGEDVKVCEQLNSTDVIFNVYIFRNNYDYKSLQGRSLGVQLISSVMMTTHQCVVLV